MIDIKIVLDALGIDGANLIAGLFGGLISTFFAKDISPRETAGILLAGAFLPAYGANAVADIIHIPTYHALVAFLLGYGGIQSMRMTYARVIMSRLAPEKGGGDVKP